MGTGRPPRQQDNTNARRLQRPTGAMVHNDELLWHGLARLLCYRIAKSSDPSTHNLGCYTQQAQPATQPSAQCLSRRALSINLWPKRPNAGCSDQVRTRAEQLPPARHVPLAFWEGGRTKNRWPLNAIGLHNEPICTLKRPCMAIECNGPTSQIDLYLQAFGRQAGPLRHWPRGIACKHARARGGIAP